MIGISTLRNNRLGALSLMSVLAGAVGLAGSLWAQSSGSPPPAPGYLTRDAAVRYALQNNPLLMTLRQQHGFAQSAIVSARTYPFNPVYTGIVAQNGGPSSAGIENRVFNEHYVTLELELRGQGRIRRAAASATATRIDWEIAQQEMAVSIAVIRAYNTVLYRQKKLEALDETIKLNEEVAEHVRRLFEGGKMKAIDLLLARAELDSTRAQRGQAKTILTVGRSELRRQLGMNDDTFSLFGNIEVTIPSADQAALVQLAFEQRPDLRARQAAVAEAQSGLQLIQANRYGNVTVGPFYEYDNTRVSIIGGRLSMPLPCLNLRRAEIMKAEADVAKVVSEVQQIQLQATQDVQAALARLAEAKKWEADYEREVVPNLEKARQEVEKLFANNDPSIDLTRLLGMTRLYLKANEILVDAHFEVSQAESDLALAVAEPALAMGPAQPSPIVNLPEKLSKNNPLPMPGNLAVSYPIVPIGPVQPPMFGQPPATLPGGSTVLPAHAILGPPVPYVAAPKN